MVEEVEDHFRAELFDLDLAGAYPQSPGREAGEQLERVGVAVDRVTAGAAIARNVPADKRQGGAQELS